MTRQIDDSHDPALRSWVESANRPGIDFPIQNLPFGVFSRRGTSDSPRIGAAIGDDVLDLRQAGDLGLLNELPADVQSAVAEPTLNRLMSLGPVPMRSLRHHLVGLLKAGSARTDPRALVPMNAVDLSVPATVGNYTDFYASVFHATRVGRLFRPDNPLLPNYKYVPIAYHGRASSIVASGTSVRRPWGQTKAGDDAGPTFRPSRTLDYEVEVGVFVGPGNELGSPIPIDAAEDHVFGLCLLNDWSARDVQAWEYQPLGPFLAKNFATTVSPWVVTLEALAPFRVSAFSRPVEDPEPLPHLASATNAARGGLDLQIEASIRSARMRDQGLAPFRLSHSSLRHMYWTLGQMLTHHASNGCNLRPGDLLGTGTISGPSDDALGCLLEITGNGRAAITLPTGEERAYLADGDEVVLRAYCEREGFARIGFGVCAGIILPAIDRRT